MEPSTSGAGGAPQWRPLSAVDRRVAGVLVEKAKTTPDAYPLSLNALTAGCNQKSNRAPQMQLAQDDVADALERLRGLGAVAEVHGDGRIARYKHRLYEWLGVDKVEMAVMAELLLRGAQTVGELRGRAARMEPIADLAALRPVLDSLNQKGLVVFLTTGQRGAVVTHALSSPEELERLRREHSAAALSSAGSSGYGAEPEPATAERPLVVPAAHADAPMPHVPASESAALAEFRGELRTLRDEIDQCHAAFDEAIGQLRRDVDDLRRQLGV